MVTLLKENRFRCTFVFLLFICLLISVGMLLTSPASATDYPPAGSEIASLQETYNQANNFDTIRAKAKIFSESLILGRPIGINLLGGYFDTTYSATTGVTRLNGSLVIRNGTLRVANFAISGAGGSDGISISNVAVTLPRIAWNTDLPADSRIDYGETTSYGSTVAGASLSTDHSLVLMGLKPNTTYHFILSSSTTGASAATADRTFTTPDFNTATIGDIGNSAVMEVSGNYDAKNGDGSLNTVPRQKIAQEYFKTHSDTIDFLVILSTFDYGMPDSTTQGFYSPVKNDTLGINQAIFDNSSQFGSNGKLQGIIDMGNVTSLAANPYGTIFDQTLTVLSHELAHRFGAYVRYKLSDNSLSTALLAKDNAHWSYLLDSQGSAMYGNGWRDNGDGTFTSISKQNAYSQLDLYLLGMIPKEQVPPMLLIDNPAIDKSKLPLLGETISGTATTVTIADIVAAEGDRVPNAATSPKQFNIGFVLLTRSGDSIGSGIQAIETLRKGFAGRFAELTHGKGSIANIPASLDVVVDSPADGATVVGPDVTISGAFINTTGVETGVTINGIPATVTGNRFIANHVPLQQGNNSITITATDANGLTASTTRSVTANPGHYIRITPNIESGTAPLNLSLRLDGSFNIATAQLSVTGPVPVTLTQGTTPAEFTAMLKFEGNYTFTVSAVGPDGQTYSDTVTVTAQSKAQLDNLIQAKWNGMRTALASREVEGAVKFFMGTSQASFRQQFTSLSEVLPEIADELSLIRMVKVKGNMAEYDLSREINGKTYSFFVQIVKDSDGIWRIRTF